MPDSADRSSANRALTAWDRPVCIPSMLYFYGMTGGFSKSLNVIAIDGLVVWLYEHSEQDGAVLLRRANARRTTTKRDYVRK
jgi:hypothetical protein